MELVTCEKYYKNVLEKFPELSEKQLDKIVKHGLSTLYLYNLYGGDVLLKNPKYTMYFGRLFKDNIIFAKYSKLKWKIKLRIKYRKAKTKYDGYYYFGLTDEWFEKYKSQIKHFGRKRKIFHFDYIYLYKILEECEHDQRLNHFFRIKYPEDCGFLMRKENYDIHDAEYIYRRNTKDKTIEPVSYEGNRNKCVKRRVK